MVVGEGVTDLVSESCPVVGESFLARQNVEVSLGPAADPVVGPLRLVQILPWQPPLADPVEESTQLASWDVGLGEQSLPGPIAGPGLRDEHVATLEGVPE